jgi:hypothetical protein
VYGDGVRTMNGIERILVDLMVLMKKKILFVD